MTSLLRKEWCYLTPAAETALLLLQSHGVQDRDLALEVLERLWSDDLIYSIGDDDDGKRINAPLA